MKSTRRTFVQLGAALAGTGFFSSRGIAASRSALERLNVAIIGAGGRGGSNLDGVKSENIVALCDVDARALWSASRRYPDATIHADFRKLLDKPQGIDAVVISTADHTHAPASVRAMRQGLHVYCEKPLGHTVREARLVGDTYRERRGKIATQMGTQIHADENYRRVVELVQSGAVGPIQEAHVWCDRRTSQAPPSQADAKVPDTLQWDLWLGPAADRPYRDGVMPGNLTWNRYWDFGNGILGDMGSHLIDLPFWALELKHPVTCEVDAPAADPAIYPKRLTVTWEHPKRGDSPHQQPCKVVWYDGLAKPERLLDVDVTGYGIGVLFVGEKGMLLADYGRRTLLPQAAFADFKAPAPSLPPSKGHYGEWVHACKTGEPTLCNFDYSGRLVEHNLLGIVAHRTGKKLEWDAKTLQATNAPEADAFVTKTYRAGWGF